ncbi:MAG: response regulator, partial [Gammaproteobacteria bacterium]|nr:response regulator [Gammaproteobacteria bacterium]
DILDFSKMEADKLELESIPFSPVDLVEETAALLAKSAHDKNLELICSIDSAVPDMVKGDPTRLRQILTNLTNNAIKFTEEGQVVIHVSNKQSYMKFSVIDTGIGISTEQQQHLFKSFSQVDSSHTRKYGGTGLGLIISQRLVNAMGGELSVVSSAGMGTEFNFTIELEVINNLNHNQKNTDLLKQQRMLLVDDNATNREVLENILKSWGIQYIESAENAMDGLAALKTASKSGQPFNCALLDMQMPEMDGLSLAKQIRNDTDLQNIKLVMLSSVDRHEPAPELDAWLTKPARRSDLFNTLMMLFGVPESPGKADEYVNEYESLSFPDRQLLLVEDNEINQRVAYEMLSGAGFKIDIRDNGAKAVEAVQSKNYDVVLMDIQMPVMDGLDATRQIRLLGGKFSSLPIIAMTAHALTGDSDKSMEAGMDAHVTKPIDPDHILEVISNWIAPVRNSITKVPGKYNICKEGIDDIPDLPGINIEDGINRMRGNCKAFKRVLLSFLDKQADSAEDIEKHIQKYEWDEATQIAHTIKGSSGNIGAEQLHKDAAAVERACQDKNINTCKSLITVFASSLEEVIGGLTKLKNSEVSDTEKESAVINIDEDELNELMDKLLIFLDSDLGEARVLLENLQQQTKGSNWESSINNMLDALNIFDVDALKDDAHEIKKQCMSV